jgi:hypothetical protein
MVWNSKFHSLEKRVALSRGEGHGPAGSWPESQSRRPIGVLRSTPELKVVEPRGAQQSAKVFRAIRRAEIHRVGHGERIERSRSKLIFFLTIHDSRALNGPVVIPDQLVNRVPALASGSTRSFAAAASCMDARFRSGSLSSGAVSVTERERESQDSRSESDQGMHISRPILKTGKRQQYEQPQQ